MSITNFFDSLPLEARRTVQGIRGLEVTIEQVRLALVKEIFELEAKYADLLDPLYERRRNIIAGKEAPLATEYSLGEARSKEDDDDYNGLPALPGNPVIPRSQLSYYWYEVLRSHPGFFAIISDADKDAMSYLTDIRIKYPQKSVQKKANFVLEFYFNSNPYFTNSVLRKTYYYRDEVGFYGYLLYCHVQSDKINWKPGKNLVEKSKGRGDDDEDEDDETSFFSFFDIPDEIAVSEEDLPKKSNESEEEREEALELRDELLEADFNLAESLKERILVNSVEYFTGEAEDYERDMDDDDEDDDEEEDEEGENDNDDDDDDDNDDDDDDDNDDDDDDDDDE